MTETSISYRTYWGIWGVLLALTLVMIGLEAIELPATATVLLLTTAMMAKALLIAGWFMHLRYERLSLILIVALTILVTASFMFFLLIPDSLAALPS